MSGFTPNFQLEFLEPGQPAYQTRDVLERMARSIDAALTRGGVAPPNAQDLVTLAGRVATLERPPLGQLIGTGTQPVATGVNEVLRLSVASIARSVTVKAGNPADPNADARLTVTIPGLYRVGGGVAWAAGTVNTRRIALLSVNGVPIFDAQHNDWPTAAQGVNLPMRSRTLSLAAGDYVQLLGRQDTGAALNADLSQCWLELKYEGPA